MRFARLTAFDNSHKPFQHYVFVSCSLPLDSNYLLHHRPNRSQRQQRYLQLLPPEQNLKQQWLVVFLHSSRLSRNCW